jgi:hypothetical protein
LPALLLIHTKAEFTRIVAFPLFSLNRDKNYGLLRRKGPDFVPQLFLFCEMYGFILYVVRLIRVSLIPRCALNGELRFRGVADIGKSPNIVL